MEIALRKYCGPDDIITPITREDEKISSSLGCRGAQNFRSPIWDYRLKDFENLFVNIKRKKRFYNHIWASDILKYIGSETWDSYYKFCFERNPWDRLVSLYYWKHQSDPRPSISQFLESEYLHQLKTQGYNSYTINGRVAVDKIYSYEEMEYALGNLEVRLGLPGKLSLPNAKSNFRKDKRHYREILNEQQKELIAEFMKKEIALMKYEY